MKFYRAVSVHTRLLVAGALLVAIGAVSALQIHNQPSSAAVNTATVTAKTQKAAKPAAATQPQITGQQAAGNQIQPAAAKSVKSAAATSQPVSNGYTPRQFPSGTITSTAVPTPHAQPAPSFSLVLSAPPMNSGNSHGFLITIVPDAGFENMSYSRPVRVAEGTPNGLPCNAFDDDYSIYNLGGQFRWGWACNPFVRQDGTMPYGNYPVTFAVVGTNNYGVETVEFVTGIIVYYQDQITYQNIF